MANVLLIDDDPLFIAEQVRQAFPFPAHTVTVAKSGTEGVAAVRSAPPDVVLLDLRLPDRSGLEVFEEIRVLDARLPVIFVTVAKNADTAIEAMKRGAFDYVYKPIDLRQLEATVHTALDLARRMRDPVKLQPAAPDPLDDGVLIGACPAMLEVYKAVGRVAQQDVTVLVTGESGTGKELVARAIYQHSARSRAPFLAMNCAAIPEALLESELFGHEKGAFTGADRRRIGKFEQYNGGTILLDEVGDMPLALQSKLLRLLQEQSFERVGGNETIRTDVRLIAATHRDLRSLIDDGQFRLDLYYRIGVFTVHLPPLRDRGDDLALLSERFVRRYSRELGRDVRDIAPETLERLRAHSWPGNIRELQSTLKQAVLQSHGFTLLPAFLPPLSGARARERRRGGQRPAARARGAQPLRRRGLHPAAPRERRARRSLRRDPRLRRSLPVHPRPRAHPRQPARGGGAARHLAPDHAREAARAGDLRRARHRARRRSPVVVTRRAQTGHGDKFRYPRPVG